MFLHGSGPGVWVQWARAPGGGRPAEIRHPPRAVDPVAETSPVLLSPVSAEVGKKGLSCAPPQCLRVKGNGIWGVSVFWWGGEEEAALFYFILVFIDLEIIPIVLEQLLLFCFCK